MKKLTVDCVILAYNSEKNIKQLLQSLFDQEAKNYEMKSIIVHSDNSNDSTVKYAKSFNHPNLKVIDSQDRLGFSGSFFKVLSILSSDLSIFLNDDIRITQKTFIEEIIKVFKRDETIALVCSKIVPMSPVNFFEKAAWIGFLAYQKYGESINNGHNVYTCDGKVICIRNSYKTIIQRLKADMILGNLDHFLYFFVRENNLSYAYAKEAYVLFRLPNNISDFVQWQTRNMRSNELSKRRFQSLYFEHTNQSLFMRIKMMYFLRCPIHSLFIFFIGLYCRYRKNYLTAENSTLWDIVRSTKEID